jgi:hypothetical protein
MFLCYVDESGFNGKKLDKKQLIQVMVGILVNLYNFHKTDNEFKEIFKIIQGKIKINEIKGSEIYRGRNKWKGIKPSVRDKIIGLYIQWLNHRKHKIILSIVDNKKFFDIKNQNSRFKDYFNKLPYPWLLSAFHISLVIQKNNRKIKNNKGRTLLIFDEEDSFENELQKLIFNPPPFSDEFVPFDKKKEKYRLNQIIDTAYFVKSHYSSLAQAADIVSFLFRLYFELTNKYRKEAYKGEKDKIYKWIQSINNNSLIQFKSIYPKPSKSRPFIKFLHAVKP